MTEETDKQFVERHWDNPIAINQRLQSLKRSKKSAALKSLQDAASEYDRDYCEKCKQVRSWLDVKHPEPWNYQPRDLDDLSRHEFCEYCKSERSFNYEGYFNGLVKGNDLKKTVKRREKLREYYQSERYIERSYFFRKLESMYNLQSEIADKKEDLRNMSDEIWEDLENSIELNKLTRRSAKSVVESFQIWKELSVTESSDVPNIPPKLLSMINSENIDGMVD